MRHIHFFLVLAFAAALVAAIITPHQVGETTQRTEAEAQRNAAESAKAEVSKQRLVAEKAKVTAAEQRDLGEQTSDAASTAAREAGQQTILAEEQRTIVQSRELAASAITKSQFDPGVGVLLATEAVKVNHTPQLARAVLRGHARAV